MTLPPVIQALLVGITVVSFLGASFVFLRGSRDKGTIESLEKNSTALDKRVEILEADIARRVANDLVRDAADKVTLERIGALERENEVLRTVDGAGEKITALARALNQHHAKSMTGIETLTAILQSNADGLQQLHTDLVQIGHLGGADDVTDV